MSRSRWPYDERKKPKPKPEIADQIDLFAAPEPDLEAKARVDRDAGMSQVDQRTTAEWKRYADEFIDAYLLSHPTLFVDDLWEAGLEPPASLRALGPRITAAARRGFMVRTEQSRPSVRSRLGHKPVWKSLVYQGGPPR